MENLELKDLLDATVAIVIYTAGVRLLTASQRMKWVDEKFQEHSNTPPNHERISLLDKWCDTLKLELILLSVAIYPGLIALFAVFLSWKIWFIKVMVGLNLVILVIAHIVAEFSGIRHVLFSRFSRFGLRHESERPPKKKL